MWVSRDCHATDALELQMYERSTKEISGCASNSLAHEDVGQFEEAHHWNIQAKFYNEKFPLVYECDKTRDSLSWRSWCYFEAQVWKKGIVALPLFILFLFFLRASLAPPFLFRLLWPLLLFLGNALIMMIITLLFTYNSILQLDTRKKIWLYMNAFGGVPGCAMI